MLSVDLKVNFMVEASQQGCGGLLVPVYGQDMMF
jgi:hypothetical protein